MVIGKPEAENDITASSVRRITARIRDGYKPDKIIVFGSAASGRIRAESDLDILVVMKSRLPSYKRAVSMYAMLNDVEFPMDILVFTPSEVKKWNGATNHVITEAFRHGRIVYDKGR